MWGDRAAGPHSSLQEMSLVMGEFTGRTTGVFQRKPSFQPLLRNYFFLTCISDLTD